MLFDGNSNRVKSITNKISKISVNVDQGFYWYNSSDGHNKNSTQASGAYIFRYSYTLIEAYIRCCSGLISEVCSRGGKHVVSVHLGGRIHVVTSTLRGRGSSGHTGGSIGLSGRK